MPETSYTTLLIHAVETLEQDFARYTVQIRLQGKTEIIAELTGGAVRQKNLSWLMTPLEWSGAIIGTTYEIRVFVEDTFGNRSRYSAWITETAGNTTPPSYPATFAFDSTIAYAKCSFSYSKPTDFGRFEWIVKYDDTNNPSSSDLPHYTSIEPELVVSGAGGELVNFWVRAIDQSGNINSGGYVDCGNINTIPPATFANLIGNGGFELGLAGWDVSDTTFTLETGAGARNGDKFGRFNSGNAGWVFWKEYFPVSPGEVYWLEVYAREDVGSGDQIAIGVKWYTADKQASSTVLSLKAITQVWTKHHAGFTAPSGKTRVRFFIKMDANLSGSEKMRFDDIIFRKLADIEGLSGDGDRILKIQEYYLNVDGDGKLRVGTTQPASAYSPENVVVEGQTE